MSGFFERLFNPGASTNDQMDVYKKYFKQGQQGEQAAQDQFAPYMQRGNEAGSSLMDFIKQMMDPQALENKWASGYEQSPYAKQMLSQNQSSGMDAASQMGLMGSSGALQNIQNSAGNIVQGDRQNYMNDLFQKMMGGANAAQGVNATGANAAGQNASIAQQRAEQALKFGDTQSALQYQKDQAPFDMIAKLFSHMYGSGGTGTGGTGTGAQGGQNQGMMDMIFKILMGSV